MGHVANLEQDLWATNQYSFEFLFAQEIARSPLLIDDCMEADLVYVPLTVQYLPNRAFEDVNTKIDNFTAHLDLFLPLLSDKPHFMATPWATEFAALNFEALKSAGVTIFTTEGDGSPEYVEVPYPGHYHHHSGLRRNRFMRKALNSKSSLAFECFWTHHDGGALNIREGLMKACLSSPGSCVHFDPEREFDGVLASGSASWMQEFFDKASTAWFCMQPAGDTFTRRSTFDCLLAGSIPVFFSKGSVDHFPWSDIINPLDLVLLVSEDGLQNLFNDTLPNISLQQRTRRLHAIARFARVFQYSLNPHTGRIRWDNVAEVNDWDDALTFSIKTLIRRLQGRHRLPTIQSRP